MVSWKCQFESSCNLEIRMMAALVQNVVHLERVMHGTLKIVREQC